MSYRIIILAIFLLFFGVFQNNIAQTIHYQIRPIPAVDRTDLEISLNYQATVKESISFNLPIDCYGFPKLSRFVTSFHGESGTIVKNGKDEGERIIEPDSKGEIHLKYVLSFDPQKMSGATYSPNTSQDYFHIAGCQWMLRFGSPIEKKPYIIEMVDAPENWKLYSSLSANPTKFEGTDSFQNLMISAIGGGKQGFSQFFVRGKPVSVFVRGKFDIPQPEILAAVRKIVALQRERFNEFDQPFYNIVILPKENNVAGTRIENLFVSFFKADVTRNQLHVLLSHEMLHNWLTSEIIKPPKGELGLKYQWFYEGFTDYFSRRILFDAGLLSKQMFAELINRDIINIADNPHKATTYQDLVNATETGKFNQSFNKLSYYRGALIALNWDTKIRQMNKTKSLGNLIEEVYQVAKKTAGSIEEGEFFELVQKNYGIDAKIDFERYILRGEPILVEPNALGNSYKLRESSVLLFDPGFLLNESRQADKVLGVKSNSAAHRAGLRDGMEIVNIENYNRFGNAWDSKKPLVVTVKESGNERKISFLPQGEPHKLFLFEFIRKK